MINKIMLLKREQALKIQDIFEIIKSKKFNIHTQYKLIKITLFYSIRGKKRGKIYISLTLELSSLGVIFYVLKRGKIQNCFLITYLFLLIALHRLSYMPLKSFISIINPLKIH